MSNATKPEPLTNPPSPAVYRIVFGAVEYRGTLDPFLNAHAEALEEFLDDDDLYAIRHLVQGDRYAPRPAGAPMAFSFTCLRTEGGSECRCPFGVLLGDCPAHGELVPDA